MKKYLFLLLFSCTMANLSAQLVNISLQKNATNQRLLEIYITPLGSYTGVGNSYISAVAFTIRWQKSCGASVTLGTTSAPLSSLPMAKSGGSHSDATYNYQIFDCIGSSAAYTAGTNYTIMTVLVNGTGTTCDFEILATYTGPAMEDGNFYVETPSSATNQANWSGINNSVNVILPIELLSFQAKALQQTAQLEWETSLENNADYFEVEHSPNGKDFVGISKIAAQGKASRYGYIDPTPQYGIAYYRLKMVDKNGTFKYSKVLSLDFAKPSDVVKVYPNPFTDHITLNLPSDKKGDIKLIDAQGRLIWSKSRQYTEGVAQQMTISTVGISQGVYWLWIGNESPLKIVKL